MTPISWRRSTTIACADNAERSHTHNEAKADEALDQVVEGAVYGHEVFQVIAQLRRFHAVGKERGLQLGGDSTGVARVRDLDQVGNRGGLLREGLLHEALRRGDADHVVRDHVLQHADDRELIGGAGLRVTHFNRHRLERAVFHVEALDVKVRDRRSEAEVVASWRHQAVDDREGGVVLQRLPDSLWRIVALGDGGQAVGGVVEEGVAQSPAEGSSRAYRLCRPGAPGSAPGSARR